MSASQEKKKRISGGREEAEKLAAQQAEEARKKSLKKVRNIIIAVIVVLVIAAIFIINSNLFYTGMTAVEVGGTRYTAAETNYIYRTIYSNYVQQLSEAAQQNGMDAETYTKLMGLDTSKPLSEQLCPYGETENETWEDFFRTETLVALRKLTMHKDKADAEGFKLTDEQIEELDSDLVMFDYYASMSGFASLDQYFAAQFGKGVTMDTVRKMAQLSELSAKYAQNKQDSFTYSDEELDAWYAEHRDEYDVISYRQTFVSTSSTAESTEEEKAEAMNDAKLKAEQLLAIATDEATFESLAAGNEMRVENPEPSGRSHALGKNLNSSYKDWLLDAARKPGDMTVLESGSGCYVLYFVGREDNSYALKQVRHILVKAEADDSGVYTDEAKEAAKTKAQEYLDEWKAGEATEESFAELAKLYSEDTGSSQNGGLYDQVVRYSYVQEFEDFAFDESRKTGDTGIVYGESASYAGYHVMYFVGEGERYDHFIADSELRSAAAEAWEAEALSDYLAATGYSFRYVK